MTHIQQSRDVHDAFFAMAQQPEDLNPGAVAHQFENLGNGFEGLPLGHPNLQPLGKISMVVGQFRSFCHDYSSIFTLGRFQRNRAARNRRASTSRKPATMAILWETCSRISTTISTAPAMAATA